MLTVTDESAAMASADDLKVEVFLSDEIKGNLLILKSPNLHCSQAGFISTSLKNSGSYFGILLADLNSLDSDYFTLFWFIFKPALLCKASVFDIF